MSDVCKLDGATSTLVIDVGDKMCNTNLVKLLVSAGHEHLHVVTKIEIPLLRFKSGHKDTFRKTFCQRFVPNYGGI